ncbi:MAG TPA: MATE family efflux transporter [Ohtaekwangia sp.]
MSVFTKLRSFARLFKQAVLGQEQEYTSGSIDRAIFLLSIPMILEMSLEGVFAVVDMIYISRLHDNDAIATVGLTESMLSIIYSIAMGISIGATAMVARRVGEKDIPAAGVAATQAIYIGLVFSVIVSIIGFFYSADLLRVMGGSEQLIANNVGFTKWMLIGNLPIVFLFLINGIFRGAGDASIALRSVILANGLNILLGPVFIFGIGPIPAYGVEGAAIGTTIGRACGVLYQVYHLLYGKGIIKLGIRDMILKWDIIGSLVKVSAGSTGQFLIGSASWIFLMRIMSEFGSAAQAGYVIAIRIIIFAILPAWGMSNAAATLVGQNLGANQPDRAEKSVWRAAFLNMLFMALVTVLSFTLANPVLKFFTDDAVTLQNGIQCLQIVCLGYIFYAYGMVINQSFNGAGDTRTPIIISFFGFWVFQIPLAYLLSTWFKTGPVGVYIAIAIAESLMAIAGIYIFRLGKWKLVKI